MDGIEFRRRFDEAVREKGTLGSPVMVIDVNSGMLYDIQNIVVETHEDADGSHTTWLMVEEH